MSEESEYVSEVYKFISSNTKFKDDWERQYGVSMKVSLDNFLEFLGSFIPWMDYWRDYCWTRTNLINVSSVGEIEWWRNNKDLIVLLNKYNISYNKAESEGTSTLMLSDPFESKYSSTTPMMVSAKMGKNQRVTLVNVLTKAAFNSIEQYAEANGLDAEKAAVAFDQLKDRFNTAVNSGDRETQKQVLVKFLSFLNKQEAFADTNEKQAMLRIAKEDAQSFLANITA